MAAEFEQPPAPQSTEEQSGEPGRERVGPLALLRTAKADGRALLIYSHAEQAERA